MLFHHADHPGRAVRLAYCLNFGEAEDAEHLCRGIAATALPLRERLDAAGSAFGIGPWLPADMALALTVPGGEEDLDGLVDFLADHRLDPFTFNAFPWGGFHAPGLKARVFRPTWRSPERLAYTLAVAEVATRTREALDGPPAAHVSISTHAGMHAGAVADADDLDACADNFAQCAAHLAGFEGETGQRLVLSIEPEPRSTANDTRELVGLYERILLRSHAVIGAGRADRKEASEDLVRRHVGTCLDTCHAAVEFEDPAAAFARATNAGSTLGKLQLTNALRLVDPAANGEGRDRLLALDEPVFLHQVTGRREDRILRAGDLPDLRAAVDAGEDAWCGAAEWRCHFHVPLYLDEVANAPGLATTRAHTEATLTAALADPERWGSPELHLEIETYTWNVLPAAARGAPTVLDGQEREYRLVLSWLAAAGWHPVTPADVSPYLG